MKLELYCTCGVAWCLEVRYWSGCAIRKAWDFDHSGPGHAPCDEVAAAMARVRKAKGRKKL